MSALPPSQLSAEMMAGVPSDQWIRRVSLIVSNESGSGLDLSQLRIKFRIEQADASTARPNTAEITIYNLADSTIQNVINEYTEVTLQAGYQPPGKFGIIFQGTIKQFKRGHESVTESYLILYAADADIAHLFGITNTTLAPGYTTNDEINSHVKALGSSPGNAALGYNGVTGGSGGLPPANVRGKLLYGLSGKGLDRLGNSAGFTWVIVNGKVQIVPLAGYLPGTAVQLNATSGLVVWPEATDSGIYVTCLLNPAIKLQGLIQINNKDINQTIINRNLSQQQTQQVGPANTFPGFSDLRFYASTTLDGFYRVLVVEYEGDSRANPWYCHLTCLAADLSAPAGQTVNDASPLPATAGT
jgi:hypothetical protein